MFRFGRMVPSCFILPSTTTTAITTTNISSFGSFENCLPFGSSCRYECVQQAMYRSHTLYSPSWTPHSLYRKDLKNSSTSKSICMAQGRQIIGVSKGRPRIMIHTIPLNQIEIQNGSTNPKIFSATQITSTMAQVTLPLVNVQDMSLLQILYRSRYAPDVCEVLPKVT